MTKEEIEEFSEALQQSSVTTKSRPTKHRLQFFIDNVRWPEQSLAMNRRKKTTGLNSFQILVNKKPGDSYKQSPRFETSKNSKINNAMSE